MEAADYYQWDRFPAKKPGTFVNATRRWPAEVGLVKVKEALYTKGVPISYVQLDDWWYNGYAYNVRISPTSPQKTCPRFFDQPCDALMCSICTPPPPLLMVSPAR